MAQDTFNLSVYSNAKGEDIIAVHYGDIAGKESLPVRVHSSCFTAEVLGSQKCDCKQQLDYALSYISENDGVVIYLPQEGRGIGLSNKVRAYALQEKGADTIEANELLGLPVDARTYEDAHAVIESLGIKSIKLLTNNPDKIEELSKLGVKIEGRIPVPAAPTQNSIDYLNTKQQLMGHLIKTSTLYKSDPVVKPSGNNRPQVHVNFAITHKSKVADKDGCCTAISCKKDWQRVHELREKYDAIAVGAKTWVSDSPRLTCRADVLGREPAKQPHRVIFSGKNEYSIEQENIGRKTIVIGESRTPQFDKKVIKADGHKLLKPLEELYKSGINTILVEGGPTLIKSFLEQELIDTFTTYVSCKSYPDSIHALTKLFPELAADEISAESFGDGTLLTASLNSIDVNDYLREVAV
jgi:GTP cyclohydrolase II